MVATDGHRLAIISRPIEGNIKFDGSILVPRRGLLEIRRVLEGEPRAVGIEFSEGFMLVETENSKVAVRLIDGEFPDYRNVLPKQEGKVAKVISGELSQALRRAVIMVTEKIKGVRLDFMKNSLAVTSSSPELGDSREIINIEYKDEPISVGFNARYLTDMAASLNESSNMLIELNGELGAAKLYAEGDESYCGVIMPMRLQNES